MRPPLHQNSATLYRKDTGVNRSLKDITSVAFKYFLQMWDVRYQSKKIAVLRYQPECKTKSVERSSIAYVPNELHATNTDGQRKPGWQTMED